MIVIPKLQLPGNGSIPKGDCILVAGTKSSVRTLSKTGNSREKLEAPVGDREDGKKDELADAKTFISELVSSLKMNLGIKVTNIKDTKQALDTYTEQQTMQTEELLARFGHTTEQLRQEKERNRISREKVRMLVSEVNSLREELRTNKENAQAQRSLASQLLAAQVLHRKDAEARKLAADELAKAKTELARLRRKDAARFGEMEEEMRRIREGSAHQTGAREEGLMAENGALREKNEAMEAEYTRLKEDMDETVGQLLVRICGRFG